MTQKHTLFSFALKSAVMAVWMGTIFIFSLGAILQMNSERPKVASASQVSGVATQAVTASPSMVNDQVLGLAVVMSVIAAMAGWFIFTKLTHFNKL
jgi:hypothetical protein